MLFRSVTGWLTEPLKTGIAPINVIARATEFEVSNSLTRLLRMEDMPGHRNRLFPLFVFFAALLTLMGCRPEDEILQGDIGEFCNGADSDCRAGLACVQGVCDTPGPQALYSCDEICTRLASCDAQEGECVGNCRATIREWGLRAKNEFGACLVEDISCEEAQAAESVPQLCYSRIEIPAERAAVCESLIETIRGCDPSADLNPFARSCNALARTSPETVWSETDRCVSAQMTGICSGIATCINDVFAPEPALVLTDNQDAPSPRDPAEL